MNFRAEVEKGIKSTVKGLYNLDLDPRLEHPRQDSFGDYATSVALNIGQQTDDDPLEIAHQLKSRLVSQFPSSLVARIDVVKPGFLNFWLKEENLIKEVGRVNSQKARYGSSEIGKGRTVVIDYSAPNIAKRFGIGHLRSTVIGQALYNLYKFSGYRVIGDNHLGDWGTQFGALLHKIKSSKLKVQSLMVDDLEKLYVEFHREVGKDPKLMEEAREWFLKLESGDKEARELWQAVVDVSKKEFDRIYALLGVKIGYAYGESFYEDKMPAVIAEIRKNGLSKKSAGAEIIEFSDLPPAILVKSDGGTTYFTRDLATIQYRIKSWNPQTILYEVGVDQKLHFQQVFKTARKLGWADGREFVHVAHGLIRLPEAGKLSTRRGQSIRLEDVLDEAIARAKKLTKGNEEISRAVGIGAIKYFDLSHQPQTDTIFDWEKLFLLEGNSAPYLQYTYARAMSVLRKGQTLKPLAISHKPLVGEAELPILRWLYRFPEVVEDATRNYSPNLLCNYLFELAQRFNSFYAEVPILKAEGEIKNLRLALTATAAQVLKNGLTLLGIETPERL